MKEKVKVLVKEGRLEFINGGWTQADEACPTFEDLINNFVVAHQYIYQEFGVYPKVSFQADPFGHSSTFAKILSDLGYDALILGRIDTQEIESRKNDANLEFVWVPNYQN